MSFKENLLRKIKLDQLRSRVLSSIGSSGSGVKVDKQSMKYLLNEAGLLSTRLRNIDMYISDDAGSDNNIFVLDNELAIYNTSINDVALRKEPTLKEMISIKNAIKILNDSDVIVSKREKSVETIYNKGLLNLELSFTSDDIKQLEYDGRAAVEWKDSESLLEILSMFSELLDYKPEPKVLKLEHTYIRGGRLLEKNEELFGPVVIYSIANDSIKMIKKNIDIKNTESVKYFHEIARGSLDAFCEGPSVIKFLAGEVLAGHNLD